MLIFLDKGDWIPAFSVDEAFEGIPGDIDLHARRMVIVKRADAFEVFATFEQCIRTKFIAYDIDDACLGGNLFEDGKVSWVTVCHYLLHLILL